MNNEQYRHYIVYIVIILIVIAGISAIEYQERERKIYGFMEFVRTDTSVPQLESLLKNDPWLVGVRSKYGYTALDEAIVCGKLDFVRLLVSRGSDIRARNKYGITPLQMASFYRKNEIIDFLVSKGVDVNAASLDGQTPLHSIITYSSGDQSDTYGEAKRCIELLISKGADVNAKDNTGETPLGRASRMGRTSIADLLRKHGARK